MGWLILLLVLLLRYLLLWWRMVFWIQSNHIYIDQTRMSYTILDSPVVLKCLLSDEQTPSFIPTPPPCCVCHREVCDGWCLMWGLIQTCHFKVKPTTSLSDSKGINSSHHHPDGCGAQPARCLDHNQRQRSQNKRTRTPILRLHSWHEPSRDVIPVEVEKRANTGDPWYPRDLGIWS